MQTDPRIHEVRELANAKKLEQAVDKATSYLALDHENGRLYAVRAYAYARGRNYCKAIEDLTQAMHLLKEPHYAYMRGQYYFREKKYTEAVSDFTTAMQWGRACDSFYYEHPALFFRAECWLRLRDPAAAKLDLGRVPEGTKIWTSKMRTREELLQVCAEMERRQDDRR